MGWPIDMERKGCESIGCYIYFVTFNVHLTHDLDLGFSRSNFENAVSQEWNGRLTWNESDVNRQDVTPTLWLSTFPSPMTLTLDFRGQILKKSYLRNGMADLHGIKGMWVRVGARYMYLYLYLGTDFAVPVPVPVPASSEQEVPCTCTCTCR